MAAAMKLFFLNRVFFPKFQTITSATHLRRPIYMAVVAQAFDLRQMLLTMSKINWEVKDVMSQHNSYVDVILRVKFDFWLQFFCEG